MVKRPVIDGFVPRRTPGNIGGDYINSGKKVTKTEYLPGLEHRQVLTGDDSPTVGDKGVEPTESHGLTRSDIDDSLRIIDTTPEQKPKKSRRNKKPPTKRKKIIKLIIVLIILTVIGFFVFIAVKAVIAGNSVFKGDIFGIVQHKKLKQDDGGRTNILVFGTSEDDPGHDAAWLTDSIMVLSINQETKDAYMVSIPRDLEVKYGQACMTDYSGKINVVYGCNYEDGKNEEAGAKALMARVSEVTGLEIPYYAHVNYSVVRDIVGALGTITVNIEGGDGAPGVMDSNFDWKCKGGNEHASRATMIKNCPPNGHFIEYPNGPAELDAEHALYLAQARGDGAQTYGLGRSNPDREQNQQKIIIAIKDKALSTGTLTNVSKVSGLIDAIGGNLRTNFATTEIRTLMDLARDIPNESITRLDLVKEGVLTGAAQPADGLYNFLGLKAFIKKTLYSSGISKENPHVVVLNASGVEGVAKDESDKLTSIGMNIDSIGNAPIDGTYTKNIIYKFNDKQQPNTIAKLEELYGVKATVVTSAPGITVGDATDYVIIVVKSSVMQQAEPN